MLYFLATTYFHTFIKIVFLLLFDSIKMFKWNLEKYISLNYEMRNPTFLKSILHYVTMKLSRDQILYGLLQIVWNYKINRRMVYGEFKKYAFAKKKNFIKRNKHWKKITKLSTWHKVNFSPLKNKNSNKIPKVGLF